MSGASAVSSPTTYTVQAHTTSAGRAVVQDGSEEVALDTAWATNPSGLPGPAQLLAAAFAACLLKNVERASQLLPFRYQSAEVHVTARRQDAPPKFVEITYELRLVTDESERKVELLHQNLRRYGVRYRETATQQLFRRFGWAYAGVSDWPHVVVLYLREQ